MLLQSYTYSVSCDVTDVEDEVLNDCSDVSCHGRGVCRDGVNSYHCKCQDGFIGKDCECEY